MSVRRTTVVLLSLLVVDAGCARLFPATKQDEPLIRGAQPRVQKDPQRRREGSDVTIPNDPDPNWPVRILAPCDSLVSRAPGGTDCRGTDQKVDTLRAPIDTAAKRRP
jgi:hypothetical protein